MPRNAHGTFRILPFPHSAKCTRRWNACQTRPSRRERFLRFQFGTSKWSCSQLSQPLRFQTGTLNALPSSRPRTTPTYLGRASPAARESRKSADECSSVRWQKLSRAFLGSPSSVSKHPYYTTPLHSGQWLMLVLRSVRDFAQILWDQALESTHQLGFRYGIKLHYSQRALQQTSRFEFGFVQAEVPAAPHTTGQDSISLSFAPATSPVQ